MLKKLQFSIAFALALAVTLNLCDASERTRLDAARVPKIRRPAKIVHEQKPIHVKVLVVEFDPSIPARVHSPNDPNAEPITLRNLAGWNDSLRLASGYMQDICDVSGALVQYEIVEWIVAREFQKKVDGFVYTPQQYYDCLRRKGEWHQPDGVDYPHFIRDFDIIPRVVSGQIDEAWMIGGPYFGYWESAMAGRDAFYINGGVYGEDQVPCKRAFAIMGFNYEREVAEMLHDLSHRTESTMSRVHGGWKVDKLTTSWARFAANHDQSNGVAAVGTCHWPPNAARDYDYANQREVLSSAIDWLNYPQLTGRQTPVSCETWGGPDYHRNYMKWWFAHLPKAPEVSQDGRQNNWWKYVFDFNSYNQRGMPKGR
jgi:hypothetical protein